MFGAIRLRIALSMSSCTTLLHELVPKASMIAVLVNPTFPGAEIRVTAVRDATDALGLELSILNASSERGDRASS